MQATTRTTKRFLSIQAMALGLAVSVLAGGAVIIITTETDALLTIGGSSTVERSAPVFHRPMDRPKMTTDVTMVRAQHEYHRPSDRGPRGSISETSVNWNRPTDRP